MVENNKSTQPSSAGNSGPAGPPVQDKEPLYGPLAAHAQSHIGGIGLGLVGLLVGLFIDSPLIAIAGLVGGFAAGTALFDRSEGQSTPIAQELIAMRQQPHQPDTAATRRPSADVTAPQAENAGRAEAVELAAAGVMLDPTYSNGGPIITPRPTGKLSIRDTQLS